jgi:hypothetical protein
MGIALVEENGSEDAERLLRATGANGRVCLSKTFRSPWQNGVAERWVGSCRRDLLDHVIILNERHLKRLMSSTCSIITKTGRILGSRRTRQQVGLQKFALRAKTRFNPFRDSAGCTIGRFVSSERASFAGRRISLQSQTEELAPNRKNHVGRQRFGELQVVSHVTWMTFGRRGVLARDSDRLRPFLPHQAGKRSHRAQVLCLGRGP